MDIVVVGAGSWGTALACVLCENQHKVTLWGRDAAQMSEAETTRENRRYLPGLRLPDSLRFTADLHAAIATLPKDEPSLIVAVVPTHTMRQVFADIAAEIPPQAIIVTASKGIENDTLLTMDDVLSQVLPSHLHDRIAVLSGPSFAKETIEKYPTAVVAAAKQRPIAEAVQRAFQVGYFRVYTSDDVIGAEVGGAVKNVIAIACGMADGLGFGHNTRAAAITRGLAEITRLGVRLGCNPLTLAGLAGMGDLVLTCNGPQSRNRQAGLLFAQGKTLVQVQAEMKQVAEGIRTVRSVHDLAAKVGVEMPISAAMYRVLYEGKPVGQVMSDLLGRPPRHELG
ncbi:MAG TPA: NAD(P)H-dependent glycerol-3-phosphate dehydrogenase [Pseudomonadota bacterium]|nr:NAD(P)H-dependent glycerol-3-phosphate dehydrogenase [Pseudomonadota bacterium]